MSSLRANTLLQGGKYRIEKVLGQGGFGITYLATQEMLNRKVCIKEFFFKEYCNRTANGIVISSTDSNKEIVNRFLNKFLKEAKTIARLDHSNIIRILDIFEENRTAYYVMDYVEGCTIEDIVKSKGAISEHIAINYINQVADALGYIHQQNINHLDVKPANIMIRKADDKAILIDFGISKQYDIDGSQTSTTPVGISHGYAPMEQYKQGGVSTFSPQADIYALGATLYKLVTGKTPPQAMDVFSDGLPTLPSSISLSVANAIKKAMQPRKTDKPQSIAEFNLLIQTSKDKKKNYIRKKTSFGEEKNILDVQEKKHPETKEELEKRAKKIVTRIENRSVILNIILLILLGGMLIISVPILGNVIGDPAILIVLFGFPVVMISIPYIYHYYCRKKIIKYINQHSTDHVCKYLREELKQFTIKI